MTVGMPREVILCKEKKRRRLTFDPLLANSTNGTATCLLTLKKIYKIVFKISLRLFKNNRLPLNKTSVLRN